MRCMQQIVSHWMCWYKLCILWKTTNDTKPWYCPNCSKKLPFSDVRDKDLHNAIHVQSIPQTLLINASNKKPIGMMQKFQQLNNLFDQSENTESCDYYESKDFQKIRLKQLFFASLKSFITFLPYKWPSKLSCPA